MTEPQPTGEVPEALRAALPDRYALDRVLGRGGMATVYLAEDRKHERRLAIKVLHPELAASIASERFLKEIRLAAQLSHPHILTLIDSGASGGFLFYVMPYVADSLRGLIGREGSLELKLALQITQEVGDALGYAHRQGIVHRDIKPENILLSEGHAVVTDFGIARAITTAGGDNLTRTGFPVGTLGYMSPEQAAGRRDLDERTDIYSLASVFYEAVIGGLPGMWIDEESGRVGRFIKAPRHHRDKLDRLPGLVEATLVKAMRLDPEQRFSTADEFAQALVTASSGSPRYSETEAREIFRRAAELDAQPTKDDALSLGGIQQIAAEAGIPPEHVHEAAGALGRPQTRAVRGGYFGLTGRVELEEVVAGTIAPQDYGAVLQEVRWTIGQAGRVVETFDETLAWEFKPGFGETTRRVQVTVSPGDRRTAIRIVESSGEEEVVQILSVVVGTGVAAAAGWLAYSMGGDVLGAILAGGLVWGGQYAALRTWHRLFVKKRVRILSDLLKRIASFAKGPGAPNELPRGRAADS